jgi:hypothetical protein
MKFFLRVLLMSRKSNRQGTAVRSTRAGQSIGWPVQMDIDLSQFINTMRFVSSVGQEVVLSEKNRNFIAERLVELQIASFHERARAQAVSNKNSIAHAYTWEEITEGAGYFKVTPNTSSPLFRIVKNNRRAGAVFSIKFMDNKQKALRDKRMEALAQGPMADHHFKDQAAELERVAIIEKDSSKVSKRRVSGIPLSQKKKPGGKRIVDLDPSGLKIINRRTVRRPNEFKNNFSEFFFEFFRFEGEGPIPFRKGGSVLANRLAYVHKNQMAYAAQARGGAGFSTARRMGGATKVTARLRTSPVIAFNEKGRPVGIAGFDILPKSSDLAAVRRAIKKTYSGSTATGAVR